MRTRHGIPDNPRRPSAHAPLIRGKGHTIKLGLLQWLHRRAQISPALFEGGERLGMQPLGCRGVTRFECEFFFPFPQPFPEIIRDTLAKPIDAGLGVLPGTCHRKGHVCHRCVPIRVA
jgi:hypothetical protein